MVLTAGLLYFNLSVFTEIRAHFVSHHEAVSTIQALNR